MNKLAAEKLTEARKAKGYTQEDMAELIGKSLGQGYSARQYQKLEEGNFPKYKKEIVLSIDKILGSKLNELIYEQNVPVGNSGTWNAQPSSGDKSAIEMALASLAKSLELQAEANRVDADSRKELVDMLKEERSTTANASAQTFEAVRAKLAAIQEFVTELSIKAKQYKSPEEVIAILNNKTASILKGR